MGAFIWSIADILVFSQILFEIRKQSYKFVSTKKLKSPKKRISG